MENKLIDILQSEAEMCKRCNCCESEWEECSNCKGSGHYIECFETLHECYMCNGKGGWDQCTGFCNEQGEHKTTLCSNCSEIIEPGTMYHIPKDEKKTTTGIWCLKCWNKKPHPKLEEVSLEYWRCYIA